MRYRLLRASAAAWVIASLLGSAGTAAAEPLEARWLDAVDGHWVRDTHLWSIGHYPNADQPNDGDRYVVYIDEPAEQAYTVTLSPWAGSSFHVDGLVIGGDTRLHIDDRRLDVAGVATIDGVVELTDAQFYADGDQTFDGAGQIILNNGRMQGVSGGTLTLGPGLTVRTGTERFTQHAILTAIDNHGLLLTEGERSVSVDLDSRNSGSIRVTDSSELTLYHFVNDGDIFVTDDGRLTLTGSFQNQGVLHADGGTVELAGEHRFAELGTMELAAADVVLTGVLDNEGAVARLDADTGSLRLYDQARVVGGTIQSAEGAQWLIDADPVLSSPSIRSARFEGVTVDADVVVAPEMELHVWDGLHLTPSSRITLSHMQGGGGSARTLMEFNTGEITGSGTIVLEGEHAFRAALRPLDRQDHTLTIGQGITIRTGAGSGAVGGSFAGSASRTGQIINEGTILAITPGQELHAGYTRLDAGLSFSNRGLLRVANDSLLRVQGNWHNEGIIHQQSGVLELAGHFTTAGLGTIHRGNGELIVEGIWDNDGHTTVLDDMLGSLRLRGTTIVDTIRGGRIESAGDAVLYTRPDDRPRLNDLELGVPIHAAPHSIVEFHGDVTLDHQPVLLGVGERDRDNPWNQLWLDGSHVRGHGEIVFYPDYDNQPGAAGNNRLYVQNPSSLGEDIHVRVAHGSLHIELRDELTNHGLITLDNPGHELHADGGPMFRTVSGMTTMFWHEFHNAGTIEVGPGTTLRLNAAWSNAGTIRTSDADVILGGEFSAQDLLGWERSGGSATLTGRMNLEGERFELDAQTGSLLVDVTTHTHGTFANGTLVFDGPGRLTLAAGATLGVEDLTLDHSVALSIAHGQALAIGNPSFNEGMIELTGGTVQGGRLQIAELGTVQGFGLIDTELRNRGLLIVHEHAGAMTVTDIFQQIGEDAILHIIWGSSPGSSGPALDIVADAHFEGMLRLEFDGVVPRRGDVFDLLSFDNPALRVGDVLLGGPGRFTELDLPGLPGHLEWGVDELYTTGSIMVVPEPATLGVLAVMLGLLGGRRRSRT